MVNSSPDPASAVKKHGSALRSTLLVSAFTLASRVMGLVREQLFAILLGAGFYADAFVVAFRIPNLLRDLFAEGALSAAFVPTFARVEKEKGKEAAWRAANCIVGALLSVVGLITVLGIVFATPIVHLFAPGFAAQPGKTELTIELARIMMPFLPVVSLAAVMMGMLNARGSFGTPALAPTLFNLAAIVVGIGLKLAGAQPHTAVIGWSAGTLAGGFLQFAVQVPPLWKQGYRPIPILTGAWRDESVRRVARLMAPATVGLAATQINIFVNTQFASSQPGANAWLNYAFRLLYLPIGIFGVAIATVTTTSLAKSAAAGDMAEMKAGLNRGLRHVAFLTVPATVGLIVLAEPVIGLLFQHGRFKASDTQATALALIAYAIGLYAYSGVKVAAPAFYALDRTRVPLIASAGAVVTNIALNVIAFRWIGYVGLAIGTSLGAWMNLAVLTGSFRSFTKGVPGPKGLFGQLARVALASAIMGLVVWGTLHVAQPALAGFGDTVRARAVRALGGVGLGAVVYAIACKLLRIGEMNEIVGALRRRRRK